MYAKVLWQKQVWLIKNQKNKIERKKDLCERSMIYKVQGMRLK